MSQPPASRARPASPDRARRAWLMLLPPLALFAPAGARGQGAGPTLGEYRAATLAAQGDSARGRRLFEDAGRSKCSTCHAVGGRGVMLGPDLSGLGGGRARPEEILESILEPSSKIHPDYAPMVVALRSGRVVQGVVRPVNEAEVEVVTSASETVRVRRAEIEEQSPGRVSVMPAGLQEGIAPGEMADLLAYLGSVEAPASGSIREAVDARAIPRALRPVAFRPIIEAAEAFERPVWFGPVPGHPGTSAVVEMQRGRVWLLDGTGSKRTLFADVLAETTPGELTGLTSLAFHPDFARNRRYFLKLHTPKGAGPLAVQVVERKAKADERVDSGEPSKPILKIPVFSEIHNGGHLAFGPDGLLYVGMGDTGPQGNPRGHGQDLGTLLGKMSRIDVDRLEGDRAYAIPPDNPFRDRPGARPEIWALGFREPWRFSFDGPTGDLWVGDVGQDLYEEATIVRAGENHGWNVVEGFRPFSDRFAKAEARLVPPVFAYHHRVGVSITGGFVYRGRKNPALVGKYIVGDFEARRVWALEQRDRILTSIVEIGRAPDRIVSFGVDSEGEIHVVGHDRGLIYRIDATDADLAAAVPSQAREVVPTSRQQAVAWKHTEARPPADWAAEGFDDSAWPESPGGFGTHGTPGAVVRTEWRSRDLWLRRSFTLPDGDVKALALSVHHDEDAEVYLNGVLAARLPGFGPDYDDAAISDEARAALKAGGKNTLAVHCHQNGGGQYIDVGIIENRGGAPVAVNPGGR